LEQVFEIDQRLIQIEAVGRKVFGAPVLLRWDQISAVDSAGGGK
jgi:hypothetical protein